METVLNSVGQWISEVGEVFAPLFLFIAGIYGAAREIITFFKNKKESKTTSDIKDLLTAIVSKDNCEGAVNKLSECIDIALNRIYDIENALRSSQSQNVLLGQMLATIFQYSSLPVEAKEHLEALLANLEFGQDGKYLESILQQNKELRETLEKIQAETSEISKTITEQQTSTTPVEDSSKTKKVYVQAL